MLRKAFKYSLIVVIVLVLAMAAWIVLDKPAKIAYDNEPIQFSVPAEVNWDSVETEVSNYASEMIKIPSIRKDEHLVAAYLQKVLEKEGIPSRLIVHPEFPDKVSLVAELGPAESENGVILLNHTDVVEVEESKWSFPPFSGEIKDEIVHGRGALDMKGMGAMELMAFILLKRNNVQLNTKVMFLAVPDEESGGKTGVQFLLDKHSDIFKGYKYILNEGGFGVDGIPKPGNKLFTVQTAEKGIMGVDAVALGEGGHGSMPGKDYSSLNMVKFLNRVQKIQKLNITPNTVEFFSTMGEFSGFPQSFFLSRVQNPIVQKLVGTKLREKKSTNAMVSNTVAITKVETKTIGHNVIPTETHAHLNIRILPGVTVEELFAQVQKVAEKHNVQVSITQATAPTFSSADSRLFRVLHKVLKDNVPDGKVSQYLSPGATDSRHFRQKGFIAYGIKPTVMPADHLSMLHGIDEQISTKNLRLGTKVLLETMIGFNQINAL